MKPNYENVDMPDKTFPIRISMNSSDNHRIFVHPHWHEEIEILYMERIQLHILDYCFLENRI